MESSDALTLAILRFNIRDFCAQYGGEKEGSDEILLRCPVCQKEKLSVNTRTKRWRCFRCERYTQVGTKKVATQGTGTLFTLVQLLRNCTAKQAAEYILSAAPNASSHNGKLPELGNLPQAQPTRVPTGLPENCIALDRVLPYMERRHISLADAREFGLGWVPPEAGGWLANRIVFPVWEKGVCLYWQARACWDEHEHVPRWPGDKFRKSLNPLSEKDGVLYYGSTDVLWNLERASQFPRVAIAEGPTSAIRLGPSAVATFGKSMSLKQVARLVSAGVRAVDFCWDGPTAGKNGSTLPNVCPCHQNPGCAWPAMRALAPVLVAHGIDVRIVWFQQGDPGDYPRQTLDWMRANAQPFYAAPFAPL